MSNGLNKRKPEKVTDIQTKKAEYLEARKLELELCGKKINALLEEYEAQYQLTIPIANGQKILLSSVLVPVVTIDLISR